MLTRGKLIVLAGIDASGKATQSKLLAERLGAKLYSFPNYKSETGQIILDHLQARWRAEGERADLVNAFVRQSLLTINRYEQSAEIEATLASGQHVVCDRYFESGIAYGLADGLPLSWVWRVHDALPRPDLSILLDVSPEESVRRRPERRDDYEKRAGFMATVREEYLQMFKVCASNGVGPGVWRIIHERGNGESKSIEFVSELINGLVNLYVLHEGE